MVHTGASPLTERFSIEALLSTGSYSTVHRALDRKTGRRVALKLPSAFATEPDSHLRLAAEGRLLSSLAHPRLVRLVSMGPIDTEGWYLALGLVEGCTLRERLLRRGALSIAETISITHQLLTALEEIHRLGILHRAVEARHVLLGPDQRVVLIDFAAAFTPEDRLLAVGQSRGRPLNPARDLWALGKLMYWMISGENIDEPGPGGLPARHDVPLALYGLAMELLGTRFARKPPSTGAFRRQLEALSQEIGAETHPLFAVA